MSPPTRDRGPVNLQAVWIDIVKASIRNGVSTHDAMFDADNVCAGFETRARVLAERSAKLAYISVGPLDPDSMP